MTRVPGSGETDALTVGLQYPVISSWHGYQGTHLRLVRARLMLMEPDLDEYTFSQTRTSLSRKTAQSRRSSASATAAAKAAASAATSAAAKINDMSDYVVSTTTVSGYTVRRWKSGRVEAECASVTATQGTWAEYADSWKYMTIPAVFSSTDIIATVTVVRPGASGGNVAVGAVRVASLTELQAIVMSPFSTPNIRLSVRLSGR